MDSLLRYDERIWKEIELKVERRMAEFLTTTREEITNDRSLDRLPSKEQIIWQRADEWLQRVYDICGDAYRDCGHEISVEFDAAVWAFCLEPFILSEEDRPLSPRVRLHSVLACDAVEPCKADYVPSFLELLLCAIGSPPEKRRSLRVSEKQSCLTIRSHLHEAWWNRLLPLAALTQLEEAATAMANHNALNRSARRAVVGLPPAPSPHAPEPKPDQSLTQRLSTDALPNADNDQSVGLTPDSANTENAGCSSSAPASMAEKKSRKSLPSATIVGAHIEDFVAWNGESYELRPTKESVMADPSLKFIGSVRELSQAHCNRMMPGYVFVRNPIEDTLCPNCRKERNDTKVLQEPGSGKSAEAGRATKWEEIEIKFISDFQIQIHALEKIETLNYAEFGLQDDRSEIPNRAWLLLRILAENKGLIRDGSQAGEPWPKVEKRIQEIRRKLRLQFGIEGDPIPFVEGTGYQTRFKISCGPSYDR
jgi:hypothetical protein